MSEEKSSSIGTMIVVAIAAGLIGYVIGKPNQAQEEASKSTEPTVPAKPADPEKPDYSKTLKQGLLAYYPFNGNAKDESGNGHDGEVVGATLAKDRHGEADKAYAFDGRLSHIIINPSASLRTPKFSINYWLNAPGTATGFQSLVALQGYQTFINFNGQFNFGVILEPRRAWVNFETPIRPRGFGWMMVSCVFDGKEQKVFVNGKKKGSTVANQPVYHNEKRDVLNVIGAAHAVEAHYSGSLDDLRLYDRGLTDEEIKYLYEQEKPKK